ncbi:FAD-dependent 5-carboxymethylaminomethyl-2-thiouridine(34) oxidoreductase MnmC [Piscinibacter koreensis]|uniref:FAD-dependent 5-carboxymethylaminomethyl-2-thiouridine(34) oxidoreductase MnmC n=1 Tax=Piscinibacter koreensis TaxID=2742824 RepID=UPI003CC9166A
MGAGRARLAEHPARARRRAGGSRVGQPGGALPRHREPGRRVHARFNRAAALQAAAAVAVAIEHHDAAGALSGLLRIDAAPGAFERMQEALDALRAASAGDVSDYLRVVDAGEASRISGIALAHPAWFYPRGGWVDPGALAQSFLARAGSRATLRTGRTVDALRRSGDRWDLIDAAGALLETADAVVLAGAGDALRLVGSPDWPVEAVRGQLSWLALDAWPGAQPQVPVAGSGYVLPPVDGRLIFGATTTVGDSDARVRASDHASNLRRLAVLTGVEPTRVDGIGGRTAWRSSAEDRLPLVGALPALDLLGRGKAPEAGPPPRGHRLDQPRFVPREPGLFICSALGSRGITWSALAAQVLAATITGGPLPLEADLIDAIDPARFVSRAVRRARAG